MGFHPLEAPKEAIKMILMPKNAIFGHPGAFSP